MSAAYGSGAGTGELVEEVVFHPQDEYFEKGTRCDVVWSRVVRSLNYLITGVMDVIVWGLGIFYVSLPLLVY